MSPYEILGIPTEASIGEAESAYRALLRDCHPDLHVHAGPEAVAWAEQRTRQLNAAIHAIRTRESVSVGAASDEFGRHYGFRTGPSTDWFGHTIHQRPSILCPLCAIPVDDSSSFRAHLLLDHAFAERVRKRNTDHMPSWLSWVPAPMFWSLLLLVGYGTALFALLGDTTVSVIGFWVGIVAYLLFLPVAYRAERYRRRF